MIASSSDEQRLCRKPTSGSHAHVIPGFAGDTAQGPSLGYSLGIPRRGIPSDSEGHTPAADDADSAARRGRCGVRRGRTREATSQVAFRQSNEQIVRRCSQRTGSLLVITL